jgi:hypothetical protein
MRPTSSDNLPRSLKVCDRTTSTSRCGRLQRRCDPTKCMRSPYITALMEFHVCRKDLVGRRLRHLTAALLPSQESHPKRNDFCFALALKAFSRQMFSIRSRTLQDAKIASTDIGVSKYRKFGDPYETLSHANARLCKYNRRLGPGSASGHSGTAGGVIANVVACDVHYSVTPITRSRR